MKIGVFTVSMPEYDVPATVKVLKELGYDGVEWRVFKPAPVEKPANCTYENRYWLYNLSTVDIDSIGEEAEKTAELCSKAGVEIYSLTTYLSIWETEEIEKVLRAAKIMNCGNIRVNLPFYDEKESYVNLFDRAREQAKVVGKLAEASGVRIVFEIHMGGIIPSASAAYRFVSGMDPRHIGIIYDPGNMVYEGFENYKLGVELLGGYLAWVHVKNAAYELKGAGDNGADMWKPEAYPLKKGSADIGRLVHILKEAGFDGYLSVEDFSNTSDTYSKLESNIEFLKSLI